MAEQSLEIFVGVILEQVKLGLAGRQLGKSGDSQLPTSGQDRQLGTASSARQELSASTGTAEK